MVSGLVKVFYFGTTVVRITDFGVNAYLLVESINRASTGTPFFDDEYKSLAKDLVDYGQKYEGKALELESSNAELNNLYDVLTELGNLSEGYKAKSEAWNKRIEHLENLFDDLRKVLGERLYLTWFSQTFISRVTHSQSSSDEIKKQLAAVKGAGFMAIRITFSSLAVGVGAYLFYDMYKDWKAWRAEERPQERVWVRRMAIARRPAMGGVVRIWGVVRAFYRQYKYHIAFYASSAFLAFTIYMLTKELEQLKNVKEHMREQIGDYKRYTDAFDILLNGTKSAPTEEQIKLMKGILNPQDLPQVKFDQEADKEALKLGYRGIVKKYNENIENVLDDIDNVYTGTIDYLSDKSFLNETFSLEINGGKNQEREKHLADCQKDYEEFKAKKEEQKKLQTDGNTADRKSKIVEIANSFKASVLDQLDSAISAVDSCIELLTMQNTIIEIVNMWLDMVEAEEQPPIPPKVNERITKMLDKSYPKRSQLQDANSISKYLSELVDILWNKKKSEGNEVIN
jgi:uncharacterized protein YukE